MNQQSPGRSYSNKQRLPKLQLHDSMEQHRGVALNWLEPASHNCTSLTISLCVATGSPNINADETSAMSAQQSNKRKLDPCHVA